jgi:hypothetical protein
MEQGTRNVEVGSGVFYCFVEIEFRPDFVIRNSLIVGSKFIRISGNSVFSNPYSQVV